MASKKKAEQELLGFKFLGGDYYYIQGLPARDVSAEEVESQHKRWGGVESFLKHPNLYEAIYAPAKKAEPKPEPVSEPVPEVAEVIQPEEIVTENDKE